MCKGNGGGGRARYGALLLLTLFLLSLGGCARHTDIAAVMLIDEENSAYSEFVSLMLPSHTLTKGTNLAFLHLKNGFVAEAFDAQAESANETGLAQHWYPQYLATPVIAIDRDRTNADVASWSDLRSIQEAVGISMTSGNRELLMAAISYGLEGDGYTLNGATQLLAALRQNGRLEHNSFDVPVMICYDYQAAAMIKGGKNIEVVVPSEGTLTYAKGLLSMTELSFALDDLESQAMLIEAGFRLIDGRMDAALYPAGAYANSKPVSDYAHFGNVSINSTRVFRRNVLSAWLYTSADGREHQFFALVYICLMCVWAASLIHRAVQKGIRRALALIGMTLIAWIIVRLVKYQLPAETDLNIHLWYSFYFFQLSLPIIVLKLAWCIDQDDGAAEPKWLNILSIFNALLILAVMTNDLHKLVFRLDSANPNRASEYGYGPVYYIVLMTCVVQIVLAVAISLKKGIQSLRKRWLGFPALLFCLMAAYTIGYIRRFPIAWESDLTMVLGLFTLLIVETMIRSGMIPVNTKYAALFAASPLGIRIIDKAKQTVWASVLTEEHTEEIIDKALGLYPLPVEQGENKLLYAASITGGYVFWQEDITELNRMHKSIEESMSRLEAANAVLIEEEKIKRAIDAEYNRTLLMAQLEAEITRHTIRLATMIEQLDSMADRNKATDRIVLLLCYIKRRCNLFFLEKESELLSTNELMVYLDEMAEMIEFCDVKVVITSRLEKSIMVRYATLLYDFFYNIIYWATWLDGMNIPVHIGLEEGDIVLRLLMPEDVRSFMMDRTLENAILSAGGTYEFKALDEDAIGISISFPQND